jgi:hypothetical protein
MACLGLNGPWLERALVKNWTLWSSDIGELLIWGLARSHGRTTPMTVIGTSNVQVLAATGWVRVIVIQTAMMLLGIQDSERLRHRSRQARAVFSVPRERPSECRLLRWTTGKGQQHCRVSGIEGLEVMVSEQDSGGGSNGKGLGSTYDGGRTSQN